MKKSIIILILIFSFVSMTVLMTPGQAQAASAQFCADEGAGFLQFPTWYKYLDYNFNSSTNSCEIKDFDIQTDGGKVLLAVAEILLRVGGMVAVSFVIYGGFQFILSQGNPENAKKARGTIIAALIGLVISASATVIVNLIGGTLAP